MIVGNFLKRALNGWKKPDQIDGLDSDRKKMKEHKQ
jgi:hypothetical protein